ncbi:hypothetical protein BJ912DRAFT_866509, partial [Pholiota molesta]
KDPDLTWALINTINDDAEIKQGLFPSPGNDTRFGKGKPKSDHHWAIASSLFRDHPKYKETFSRATTPAQKATWATKIKNRLSALVKSCRGYTEEMGETGAGITREDEIDMSLTNSFTTKWGIIQQTFPWYWVLKSLISERPNISPVGLGNNSSGFDVDMLSQEQTPQPVDTDEDSASESIENADADQHSDNDVKPELDKPKQGRKCTAAKPATSTTVPVPKKVKNTHEKFTEIALKEEETTQKLLDIKKEKQAHDNAVAIASIQAKAGVKMRRAELQMQLLARREEQKFQLELARIQNASSGSSSSSPFPFPSFNDANFSSDGPLSSYTNYSDM